MYDECMIMIRQEIEFREPINMDLQARHFALERFARATWQNEKFCVDTDVLTELTIRSRKLAWAARNRLLLLLLLVLLEEDEPVIALAKMEEAKARCTLVPSLLPGKEGSD